MGSAPTSRGRGFCKRRVSSESYIFKVESPDINAGLMFHEIHSRHNSNASGRSRPRGSDTSLSGPHYAVVGAGSEHNSFDEPPQTPQERGPLQAKPQPGPNCDTSPENENANELVCTARADNLRGGWKDTKGNLVPRV